MSYIYKPYSIIVEGMGDVNFDVLMFEGKEGLNRPYEYEIDVVLPNEEVDVRGILSCWVKLMLTFRTEAHSKVFYINGTCEAVSMVGVFLKKPRYRIRVVPRIKTLDFQHSSKVYMNVTIQQIIEECMKLNNFTKGMDYDIVLSDRYEELEFVCQYNESDLNFLTRWLENYGIYYYVQNSEDRDKVIFTDSNPSNESAIQLVYREEAEYLGAWDNVGEFNVTYSNQYNAFEQDHYDGTRKVIGVNSASTKPYTQDMTYRVYGGNPQIKESFSRFEVMEQERLEVSRCRVKGRGSAWGLFSGVCFNITGGVLERLKGDYMMTEFVQKGDQRSLFFQEGGDSLYENEFEGIPYSTMYRPKKVARQPIFKGVLNATIDGVSEDIPLVDELGRYKVLLPFDTLEKEDGKASIPVRVVQPSASNERSGMHFKLLKGDEVALGFLEGDIDRPIIIGAVNNSAKVSDVDGIKRENTSIELDNDVLIVQTPQKIEIIG